MRYWRRWGVSCLVALGILCGNRIASAEDVLPKAGTWELGLRTGYIWGLRKHAEMIPVNLRIGYTLFKGQWWIIPAGALEISAEPFASVIHSIRPGGGNNGSGGTFLVGADLNGYNNPERFPRRATQPKSRAHGSVELGIGLPVFTYYFDTGTRLAPYIEGGLGLLYTDLRGYELGGHFSFMENIGIGASYFLSDNLALNAMWRYRHISNANLYDHNAGLDSGVILAGFSYFLP
jgi:opacity protein-like surface antigen